MNELTKEQHDWMYHVDDDVLFHEGNNYDEGSYCQPVLYEHPWYKHVSNKLIRPNPPTKEAVRRAKFRDKTYQWSRDNNTRPRK